jgi:two-component system sensor histidine kinase UhpB
MNLAGTSPPAPAASHPLRVLIVEDSEEDALLLVRELRRSGFAPEFQRVETGEAMRAALAAQSWDLVIVDHAMPRFSSFAALEVLREERLDVPCIVVSGMLGEESAVAAMKAGASDYIMKGNLARLSPAVARELREAGVRRAGREAEAELARSRRNYETLVNAIDGIVWEAAWDPAASACRYEFVSRQAERLLGQAVERWTREPDFWIERVHPEDREAVRAHYCRRIETGGNFELEFRLTREGRAPLWVREFVSAACEPGGIRLRGVTVDVSELKRAERKLNDYNLQLRDLAGHLISVREAERARIAREVHDELGQQLTGLKMELAWLEKRLGGVPDAGQRRQFAAKFEAMARLIDATIQSVRKISTDLRPAILDNIGLLAALEWQAREFQERTGIECDFRANVEDLDWHDERATALFRIFQEALTNVARHAAATRVEVRVERAADGVKLTVHDNGRGLAAPGDTARMSLGILGMKERALLAGGEFEIAGAPGRGTTVTVRLPFTVSADDSLTA